MRRTDGARFGSTNEEASKPIGSRWRFTSNHNSDREFSGRACTVVQHNPIVYPYCVAIDDGPTLNAVNRQLQPLEAEAVSEAVA